MMRRLIFIVICCLLMGGCSTPSEKNSKPIESANPSEPQRVYPDCGTAGVSLDSLDEYEEFCDSGKMTAPNHFVYYRQIAEVGLFDKFVANGFPASGFPDGVTVLGFNSYCYKLTDEFERSFSLDCKTSYVAPTAKTLQVLQKDMRKSIDRHYDGSFYSYEEIIYEYDSSGTLNSIVIQAKGAYFILTAEDGFDQFEPNSYGTFVERLLCLESAPTARDEFVEMISAPYNPEDNTPS